MSAPLHPQELLRRVAEAHVCSPKDVLSHSRHKEATDARTMLYLLLHEECRWPPALIAAKLGRDRSTVHTGIAQARVRLQTPDGAYLYHWVRGQDPEPELVPSRTQGKEPTSHNESTPLTPGDRAGSGGRRGT